MSYVCISIQVCTSIIRRIWLYTCVRAHIVLMKIYEERFLLNSTCKHFLKLKFSFSKLNLFSTEEAEKPADLNQRIIFKVKKKKDEEKDTSEPAKSSSKSAGKSDKKSKKDKEKPSKNLLSFDDEEGD